MTINLFQSGWLSGEEEEKEEEEGEEEKEKKRGEGGSGRRGGGREGGEEGGKTRKRRKERGQCSCWVTPSPCWHTIPVLPLDMSAQGLHPP